MKHNLHKSLLFFCFLYCANISAISIVYNLRIAQITKQAINEEKNKQHSIVSLIFDQYQQKYNGINQNYVGGLASYIYNFQDMFFRTDFAMSNVQQSTNNAFIFLGTQTDDILFTIGRSFTINKHSTVNLSGLFGIPTHQMTQLQYPSFGYGQYGLGLQLDGIQTIHNEEAIIYAARYIRFIPRNAKDRLCQNYTFSIGNIADVLFAYKNYWHENGIEAGYTFRTNFGANACPQLDDISHRTNYMRSNFYFVYKYKFSIDEVSNRLLFNISYGFDHSPKVYGNKYIVTLWGSWNIRF